MKLSHLGIALGIVALLCLVGYCNVSKTTDGLDQRTAVKVPQLDKDGNFVKDAKGKIVYVQGTVEQALAYKADASYAESISNAVTRVRNSLPVNYYDAMAKLTTDSGVEPGLAAQLVCSTTDNPLLGAQMYADAIGSRLEYVLAELDAIGKISDETKRKAAFTAYNARVISVLKTNVVAQGATTTAVRTADDFDFCAMRDMNAPVGLVDGVRRTSSYHFGQVQAKTKCLENCPDEGNVVP